MSPIAPCAPPLAGMPSPSELSFRRAVATAVAVLASTMLPVLLTASSAAEIDRDLAFGDGRLGVAVAAFWACAALASTAAGRLADAFGGPAGVRLGGVLSAAGALGIAVAADVYAVFVAMLALTGVGLALVAPGMSALVSRQLQPGRQGVVLGFQQAGPPAASLLAGLALPAVAADGGWRWSYAAAALLILATVAVVPARDCRVAPAAGRAGRPDGVLPLALGGGLAAAAASAGITFLVPLTTARGLSATSAGLVLALIGLVTMAVRIALGVGVDARRVDPVPAMTGLLAVGAIGFVLLASGLDAILVPAAVLALGIGWGWGGLFIVRTIEQAPRAPGTAVGVAMRGVYAGAVAGPVVGGPVAAASPAALWLVCAALAAASASAFVRQERRRPTASGRVPSTAVEA